LSEETDRLEEQDHLDRSYAALENMRKEADTLLHSVLDLGRGGTFQSRTERDIVVRTSLARLAQLDIGDQALYFGRIDHVDKDGEPGDSFHIGRLAVSNEELEPLVVDWRAPVAEPFYRATGLDPQGLRRRRHLGVKGRQVLSVEDELFTGEGKEKDSDEVVLGGPGALMAALDAPRMGHMGDIVATIQREQDEIIRAPLAGLLIVQGGPGTGKTAVALHRAAYLLYTHRFPLERQRVLVVGPNPLFLRYIERVLPSLGESGVTLSTIAGLVPEVKVRASDSPAQSVLKGDLKMLKLLANALVLRERALREELVVPFGATTLRMSVAQSKSLVTQLRRRSGTHNARRRQLERAVVELLDAQYQKVHERYSEEIDEFETTGDSSPRDVASEGQERRRTLLRHPSVAEALDRMWPRLLPHEFIHDLFSVAPLLKAAANDLFDDAQIALLLKTRAHSLDEVSWSPADAALVDEARVLLGPVRPKRKQSSNAQTGQGEGWPQGLSAQPINGARAESSNEEEIMTFGHIVVDEIQGLSPMQLRMLARRSISGSMTVVGDLAQATGAWTPDSWSVVAEQLTPGKQPHVVTLSVGYRTPAEVLDVAQKVLDVALPGVMAPRPVRRSGRAPRFLKCQKDDLMDVLAGAVKEEMEFVATGRVGVLVPRGEEEFVMKGLAERGVNPIDPRDPDGPGLRAPLIVLAAHEAHGLEFDSAVVVEPAAIASGATPSDPLTQQGLRTLYVALTRPTRSLVVVHSSPLPVALGAEGDA